MPSLTNIPLDPEAAFAAGHYVEAARHARDDRLRGAALVLLGAFDLGLPLIQDDSAPRSLFAAAVAEWAAGNPEGALARLKRISPDSSYARPAGRLAGIIARGRVRILIHGREDPTYPSQDVVGGLRRSAITDIQSIGFGSRADIAIEPGSTLSDVTAALPTDWAPDLYLSSWLEDHPPPAGIEAAPYPTFHSTIDFDRHFHHCRPWFSQFDGAIATSGVDHAPLAALTNGQAFTCPFPYGMESFPDPNPGVARPVDMVVSGTLFKHSEAKTVCMYDVSQLPDAFVVEMFDRLDRRDYLESLRRAKFTVAHLHRPGVLSSRAFEALGQGCCVLYQEESDLGLFLGPEDGAFPYAEGQFVSTALASIGAYSNDFSAAALQGAQKVRALFELDSCMNRYAAVLTAYAVLVEKRRQPPVDASATMWRPNRSPNRILYQYDTDAAKVLDFHHKFHRAVPSRTSYAARDAEGEAYLYQHLFELQLQQLAIDEYRVRGEASGSEHVLRQLATMEAKLAERAPTEALTKARDIYQALWIDFPDRLAAGFNLARIAVEGGWLDLVEPTLGRLLDSPDLRYVAEDLLFWREFHDPFFDYDGLMRHLVDHAIGSESADIEEIERFIRESSAFYLLRYYANTGRVEDERLVAQQLRIQQPALHALQILLAERLLAFGDSDAATRILEQLAEKSPWVLGQHAARLGSLMEATGSVLPGFDQARLRLQNRMVARIIP